MAQVYAAGTYAWGICDVCGFRYKLNTLKPTTVRGRKTGFKACHECWDPDHPQNFLPDEVAAHGADAEALEEPRPEINSDRDLFGDPDWLVKLQQGSVH